MSCGTPVIAYRNGSVPEIIADGITGFIVDSQEEALRKIEKINELDRHRCREEFLKRFSASRMTSDYVNLYEHILEINDRYAYSG
jgi:glycosyltransferase involved in cell wall biosynthesis